MDAQVQSRVVQPAQNLPFDCDRLLPGAVLHDKAGGLLLDNPWRRETGIGPICRQLCFSLRSPRSLDCPLELDQVHFGIV